MILNQIFKAVVFYLGLFTISNVNAAIIRLDELDLSASTQGYGIPLPNKTVDGKKIIIAGKNFEHGFGTHAVSSLIILLDGKTSRFKTFVGLDDEVKGHDSAVEFILKGDDRQLWNSGLMRVGDEARLCDISLIGVKRLELIVTDGGNGNYYDHADWADAEFTVQDGATIRTFNPISSVPYILTPIQPASPKINGASIYGIRPCSSFLYRIPATGERPMTFAVKGLPKGLKVDVNTGIITGAVKKEGTYIATFIAKNKLGVSEKSFRIICGKQIALTPPMGWNSWNCFAGEVSADKVKRAADAMINSGLINHGWNYINIDDYWQNHRSSKDSTIRGKFRDSQGYIIPNNRFGSMKDLSDYIHTEGMKVGLYSSPGPWTCGGCTGSYGYERQDAESYAKWEFDYLKYDWCSYGNVIDGLPDNDPNSVSSLSYNGGNELETAVRPYKLMGNYLRKQPRDIAYSLCQYGMADVWKWGDRVGGNCWRTTNDITDTWASVESIALSQDASADYAKPGNWNDPDMLVLGVVGWGNPHKSKLKPDEQYLHFSLWCMFSAPLLIGCDMEKLDDFTLGLLTNDEVIAIDQDALGKEAKCMDILGNLRIYVKQLEDGSKAVAFCNFGIEQVDIKYNTFSKLGISGHNIVRDLWRQKDLTVINADTDSLDIKVPAHGVLLYKLYQ